MTPITFVFDVKKISNEQLHTLLTHPGLAKVDWCDGLAGVSSSLNPPKKREKKKQATE